MLPPMEEARGKAAGCIARRHSVFAFCGAVTMNQATDSIEKLSLNNARQGWVKLDPQPIGRNYASLATFYNDKIILYGGAWDYKTMYQFDYERNIISQFNDQVTFTRNTNPPPFVVTRGKIFMVY